MLPLKARRDKQQGTWGNMLFLLTVTPLFPPLPHTQTYTYILKEQQQHIVASTQQQRSQRQKGEVGNCWAARGNKVHVFTHACGVSKKGMQIRIWPLQLPCLDHPAISLWCRSIIPGSLPKVSWYQHCYFVELPCSKPVSGSGEHIWAPSGLKIC